MEALVHLEICRIFFNYSSDTKNTISELLRGTNTDKISKKSKKYDILM